MEIVSCCSWIEIDDVYKHFSGDFEKWVGTSNYDEKRRKRPLPKGKKRIVFIKCGKGGKVNATAPKSYLYCLKKEDQEIKDPEFIREKGVKKLVDKE